MLDYKCYRRVSAEPGDRPYDPGCNMQTWPSPPSLRVQRPSAAPARIAPEPSFESFLWMGTRAELVLDHRQDQLVDNQHNPLKGAAAALPTSETSLAPWPPAHFRWPTGRDWRQKSSRRAAYAQPNGWYGAQVGGSPLATHPPSSCWSSWTSQRG